MENSCGKNTKNVNKNKENQSKVNETLNLHNSVKKKQEQKELLLCFNIGRLVSNKLQHGAC